MFDWKENFNGNYVHIFGPDDLMTVYRDEHTGMWKGIYQDDLLIGSYDTAEEAQDAMERYIEGNTHLVMKINDSGRSKKDGNYYQRSRHGIAKVHQAKNGMWFITINGVIIKNLWLTTESEAIKKAASIRN
jgi:hypothetical protein